jgi:hypothetical protein
VNSVLRGRSALLGHGNRPWVSCGAGQVASREQFHTPGGIEMSGGTQKRCIQWRPIHFALDVVVTARCLRRTKWSRMGFTRLSFGTRGLLVVALIMGATTLANVPAASAFAQSKTKSVHLACSEASGGWVEMAPGVPPGNPQPWTLGDCNHGIESGSLSSNFSINTGTSSVAWANGATSTINYWVDSVSSRETSQKCPADQWAIVYGAFLLLGRVTGYTVGSNNVGVSGRLRALICWVQTGGEVSYVGYTVAPGTKFAI